MLFYEDLLDNKYSPKQSGNINRVELLILFKLRNHLLSHLPKKASGLVEYLPNRAWPSALKDRAPVVANYFHYPRTLPPPGGCANRC